MHEIITYLSDNHIELRLFLTKLKTTAQINIFFSVVPIGNRSLAPGITTPQRDITAHRCFDAARLKTAVT